MSKLQLLAREAATRSRGLGHILGDWAQEHYAWGMVAWCENCGLAACVDTQEDEAQVFGSCTQVRCGEAPLWL